MTRNVITAIVETFIAELGEHPTPSVIASCTDFIMEELRKILPFFRFGLVMLLIYLEVSAIIVRRKRFTKSELSKRALMIKHWALSSLFVKKKFVQFFLNLTILAYFDNRATLQSRGVDLPTYITKLRFYYG